MTFDEKKIERISWANMITRSGKVFKDNDRWVEIKPDVVYPIFMKLLKDNGYKVEPVTQAVLIWCERLWIQYLKMFAGTPIYQYIAVSADPKNPKKWKKSNFPEAEVWNITTEKRVEILLAFYSQENEEYIAKLEKKGQK
jgi:hypothetical protein